MSKRKREELIVKRERRKRPRRVRKFLKRHKLFTCVLLLILLFAATVFGTRFVIWYFTVETNTDAQYTTKQLQKSLAQYKDLSAFLEEESLDDITYIIPGLKSTRSLRENDAGEACVCHSMTPQGICVTEDYVLISAYCHRKRHNSVIYVMSRVTHEFIKEIVLPGRPHVGSLAYDTEHQNIWVACYGNGMAYVNSFSLDDLEQYYFDDTYRPIQYDQKMPLHKIEKASFLYYYKNNLYVGCFVKNRKQFSTMQRYPINDEGSLLAMSQNAFRYDMGMENTHLVGSIEPHVESKISARCQGMAFYGNHLFLAQSYSMLPSKLRVLFIEEGVDLLDATDDNAALTLTMPPMLEQIYVDGDDMYLMFESGGAAYRWRVSTRVDRVLRVRVDQIAALLQTD